MRCTVGRTRWRAGWRRGPPRRAGGAQEVEQVRPLGRIEPQRVRDAVDHTLGDAGGIAPLEPDVVLGRDAGKQRDLLAAQARDASAVGAVHGQPGLRGTDPGSTGGQELADLAAHVTPDFTPRVLGGLAVLVAACHAGEFTSLPAGLGVTASTPFAGTPPPLRGLVQ
jgi:hypothetical protein